MSETKIAHFVFNGAANDYLEAAENYNRDFNATTGTTGTDIVRAADKLCETFAGLWENAEEAQTKETLENALCETLLHTAGKSLHAGDTYELLWQGHAMRRMFNRLAAEETRPFLAKDNVEKIGDISERMTDRALADNSINGYGRALRETAITLRSFVAVLKPSSL